MKRFRAVQILLLGIIILFVVVMSFNQSNGQSPSTVVVNGLPMKKVISDIEGTESVTVSEKERLSYRLLITKKGKQYVWASRDNKELIFSQNGAFYDFVEPNGRGYIRVSIVDGKCLYMEHLTLGFKNITYWGVGEECNLK
jgi:hypothetical protein